MKPNDSGFWQYKVYADIRGGSQDLCKFSLDLRTPVSIYDTGMARRTRCQDHVVSRCRRVVFRTVPVDIATTSVWSL